MNRRLSMIVMLPLLLAATSAAAQTATERIRALPETMLGVSKSYRDGNTSVTLYWGEPTIDPMIGVWITDWPERESWGGVRDGTRAMLSEAKLTKVIREADFEATRVPGVHGFYGEYETDFGMREIWILIQDGVLTKVNAAYFQPSDHDRIFQEVEQKLFGKITLNDSPDAALQLSAGKN